MKRLSLQKKILPQDKQLHVMSFNDQDKCESQNDLSDHPSSILEL